MTTTEAHVRHCSVYRGKGELAEQTIELDPVEPQIAHRAHGPPVPDRFSIRSVMSPELLCARPDLKIAAIFGLMMKHRVGCVPVVDERRRPVGVITKFDLVEQLDAALRCSCGGFPMPADLTAQTAEDLMMPIALTLDIHATIAHAAAMMMSEETHHVLVVNHDGALVGVVSAKDIVGWVSTHDVLAPRRRGHVA
jgi:CBS domain-containing protein